MTTDQSNSLGGFSLIAPKDIFERKHIGYADGRRLMCKGIKEGAHSKEYALLYLLTNTIH